MPACWEELSSVTDLAPCGEDIICTEEVLEAMEADSAADMGEDMAEEDLEVATFP